MIGLFDLEHLWEAEMETIIGVALGALIGFLGTYLNHFLLLRQERRKEGRQVIANVARALGEIHTAMESICFLGEKYPKYLNEQKISNYEGRIETHLGNLLGVIALVAVHDREAYNSLGKQVETVRIIDFEIAKALEGSDKESVKLFAGCQERLTAFYASWAKAIECALRKIDP